MIRAVLFDMDGVLASFDAHNARNLKQAAGFAVSYGLPYEVALQSVTLTPTERLKIAAQSMGTASFSRKDYLSLLYRFIKLGAFLNSIAVIYEKMDYYTAAIKYFDGVIETYHDTKYAPQAMYKKIELLMDREREDEALTEMKKFIKQYPDDDNIDTIEELKNSLESKLRGSFSSN